MATAEIPRELIESLQEGGDFDEMYEYGDEDEYTEEEEEDEDAGLFEGMTRGLD
jgi:hypothetical protein